MLPDTTRRLLHWAGSGLAVLGVGFVATRLVSHADKISFARLAPATLLALFGLAFAYGVANLFLALSWREILQHLGVAVDARWAIRTHGITQLAKYVPGNIFHLAGRQAVGQAAGLPALALAKSGAWELGSLAVAGACFTPLAAVLVPRGVVAETAAFAAVIAAGTLLAHRVAGPRIARGLALHFTFHLLSGGIFAGALALAVPCGQVEPATALRVCGASVLAWLAGFLTPGAPAGAGVRELVLLVLLGSVATEADLLAAVVFGRTVTVAGDILYFLLAGALARTAANTAAAPGAGPGA